MSGRSSTHSPTVRRLFWIAVLGGCAGLAYGCAALLVTALLFTAVGLHRLDRPRRFRALVRRIVRRHANTLALRRRQERFVDAYGNTIEDGWLRERAYFAERTVLPLVEARGYAAYVEADLDAVIAIVERVARSVRLPEEADAPEDGIAYERFCAARLREAGWKAHTTPPGGDQGADIVAESGGTRLVLQCKRWRKPAGNGAVQEIAAAAKHWSAERAAVVSTAGFTSSARKLAASTGVMLLHHDDLADLVAPQPPARRRPARA